MVVNVGPNYYDTDAHVPLLEVSQVTALLTPVLLLPSQLMRVRASIQNYGPNTIFIGPDQNVSLTNGYKVALNTTLSFNTTAEVWVIAQTAICTVGVLIEQLMGQQ